MPTDPATSARMDDVLALLRSNPGGLTAGRLRNTLCYSEGSYPGTAYHVLAKLERSGLVRCTEAPNGIRDHDEARCGSANWFAVEVV